MSKVKRVDIVVGLAFGDEGKGKIASHLAKVGKYDLVARWAGGNNAGHTVYVNGKKYKTHLVPSGVFHGIPSLVGPGCVLHEESFLGELRYLNENGFDTSLVKVHPSCHIVTDEHIALDRKNLAAKLGTTSRGIAPVYASKAARTGILAREVLDKKLLWKSELSGNILCEGAQGVWLDIDHGSYPYVTSSVTLPYGACSLGFPPQLIGKIYGAIKAYDTRSGEDPLFPASLLDDPELKALADIGEEYGVTTGRRRKTRWLDMDRLIRAINMTGATDIILSKVDIVQEANLFKFYLNEELLSFDSYDSWSSTIDSIIRHECLLVNGIIFSSSPETI